MSPKIVGMVSVHDVTLEGHQQCHHLIDDTWRSS